MTTKYKVYVADTENNVPRPTIYQDSNYVEVNDPTPLMSPEDLTELDLIEAASQTRVWAAALCPVKDGVTADDVLVDNSIEGFIARCRQLPSGSKVYFHNLAYDGPLLTTALIRMGYTLSDETGFKKPAAGTFKVMVSDTGAWYSISVTFHHGNRHVRFDDSLKVLPFSVDNIAKSLKTRHQKLIGSIDYQLFRPVGYEPTDTEVAYIKNDVLVMAEALHQLHGRETDLTKSLTIGSACMREYKKMLGKGDLKRGRQVYDAIYAELDPEVDAKLRKGYRGGWCQVNRDNPLIANNEAVDLTASTVKGNTYDVVSLYPSAMHGKVFPVGEPIDANPSTFDGTDENPYIIRMRVDFTVKPKHLPFIQLKGNSIFAENEYVKDSQGTVEITLTKPDYELFVEQYDISYMDVLDYWRFAKATGLFDEYIDHWFEVKRTATNPVDRMIAKLMLNNLYGKMAQSMLRNSGVPYLDEDGVLRLSTFEDTARGGYIPVGSFITAYARCVTIRAAQKNFDGFLYADTDSMHMVGEAVGIEIDKTKLGAWDHEAVWDMGRFVRQKTYIERTLDGEVHIKAAGATQTVKERITRKVSWFDDGWKHKKLTFGDNDEITDPMREDREIFERFTYGLTEAGKLRRLAAVGGPVLSETTFRIHPPAHVTLNPTTGLADTVWSVVS